MLASVCAWDTSETGKRCPWEWVMKKLQNGPSLLATSGRHAGVATYALVQSLMVNMVAKGAISLAEGAAIYGRASLTLRTRSDDFECEDAGCRRRA